MEPNSREPAILPPLARIYFLSSVLVLALAAAVLDTLVLPWVEGEGHLVAEEWIEESQLIFQNNTLKNTATAADSVWRSRAFDVRYERKKSHRILVMGDSFVWGDGYANMNDLWWRQLERELERRGHHDVEVIGAGLCGWNTRDQLRGAQTVIPLYRPDLVIWGYVTNDADEWRAGDPVPDRPTSKSEWFDFIFPRLSSHLKGLWWRKRASEQASFEHGFPYLDWTLALVRHPENLESFRQVVGALGTFQAATGLPAFVMSLPTFPGRKHFEDRHRPVRDVFEAAGLPFFDTTDALVAKLGDFVPSGKRLRAFEIIPGNAHPSPMLAHFYAVQAADILESIYSEQLGPKTPARVTPRARINDWQPAPLEWTETSSQNGAYRFRFPETSTGVSWMPMMPLGEPHALFSLADPVALRTIRVRGAAIESAEVAVTYAAEDGSYDAREVHRLGRQSGSDLTWSLSRSANGARPVSTIRLMVRFGDGARHGELLIEQEVPRP